MNDINTKLIKNQEMIIKIKNYYPIIGIILIKFIIYSFLAPQYSYIRPCWPYCAKDFLNLKPYSQWGCPLMPIPITIIAQSLLSGNLYSIIINLIACITQGITIYYFKKYIEMYTKELSFKKLTLISIFYITLPMQIEFITGVLFLTIGLIEIKKQSKLSILFLFLASMNTGILTIMSIIIYIINIIDIKYKNQKLKIKINKKYLTQLIIFISLNALVMLLLSNTLFFENAINLQKKMRIEEINTNNIIQEAVTEYHRTISIIFIILSIIIFKKKNQKEFLITILCSISCILLLLKLSGSAYTLYLTPLYFLAYFLEGNKIINTVFTTALLIMTIISIINITILLHYSKINEIYTHAFDVLPEQKSIMGPYLDFITKGNMLPPYADMEYAPNEFKASNVFYKYKPELAVISPALTNDELYKPVLLNDYCLAYTPSFIHTCLTCRHIMILAFKNYTQCENFKKELNIYYSKNLEELCKLSPVLFYQYKGILALNNETNYNLIKIKQCNNNVDMFQNLESLRLTLLIGSPIG